MAPLYLPVYKEHPSPFSADYTIPHQSPNQSSRNLARLQCARAGQFRMQNRGLLVLHDRPKVAPLKVVPRAPGLDLHSSPSAVLKSPGLVPQRLQQASFFTPPFCLYGLPFPFRLNGFLYDQMCPLNSSFQSTSLLRQGQCAMHRHYYFLSFSTHIDFRSIGMEASFLIPREQRP
jgi:hypothetical protein